MPPPRRPLTRPSRHGEGLARAGRLGIRACPWVLTLGVALGAHPEPGQPGKDSVDNAPPRVAARENATGHAGSPALGKAKAVPDRAVHDLLKQTGTHPVDLAKLAIADCRARFTLVKDYTCTFAKRERVDGRLTSQHEVFLKARTHPLSFYMKFRRPNAGREAIYVAGRYDGKLLAHDVGIGKLLAGTMRLDPNGSMAMEDTRHPITEAGIGALIETVARHWDAELSPGESAVRFDPNLRIGSHDCTLIETVHPHRQPNFLYHKVRLFVDREHNLPIRFEAYDWPRAPGGEPVLVEEFTYLNLKINTGLADRDFSPENAAYSFGRF